jgi:tol-pal system protein YbgF
MRVALGLVVGTCMGCATVSPPAPRAPLAQAAAPLERDPSELRVRTLESALALREAEIQQLEQRLDRREAQQVVRIGAAEEERCEEPAPHEPEPPENESVDSRAPRPLLRIHGPDPVAPSAQPALVATPAMAYQAAPVLPGRPLLPAPPVTENFGRLPVAEVAVPPIPSTPLAVLPSETAPPIEDPAVLEYRLVEAHQFERAAAELAAFERAHASHEYADNARYWLGEMLFAHHQYEAALTHFTTLISRYPRGNKVPDALARAAACYRRLGRPGDARPLLQRLLREYPTSIAAQSVREET